MELWKLRRLAPRALRVLARHKQLGPALEAYSLTLQPAAATYIESYDALRTITATRGQELNRGKVAVDELLDKMVSWAVQVAAMGKIENFDRREFGNHDDVPDDVISDAQAFVSIIANHLTLDPDSLPFAQALIDDLTPAIEKAKAEWGEADGARNAHQQLVTHNRVNARLFADLLVAFRQSIARALGRNHPDYQTLRTNKVDRLELDDDDAVDLDTAWTRMRRAKPDTPEGRAALAEVIRDYWSPLYHYVRRRGHAYADAQDATQGFVESILESKLIEKADPARGSFRGLLKTALDNYLCDRHRRESAHKRGGAADHLALDFDAELAREAEIDPALTPDEVLQQQWAESFRRRVDAEVAKYYAAKGRLDRFEALLHFVFEPAGYGDYATAGEALGMSRNHVAVFVDRLGERWRDTARLEAAWSFGTLEAGDEEMRALGFGEVLEKRE